MELYCADDARGIAGDEENCAGSWRRETATPPFFGLPVIERRKKTDRRSGFDGIDEQRRERAQVGFGNRRLQALDHDVHYQYFGYADSRVTLL